MHETRPPEACTRTSRTPAAAAPKCCGRTEQCACCLCRSAAAVVCLLYGRVSCCLFVVMRCRRRKSSPPTYSRFQWLRCAGSEYDARANDLAAVRPPLCSVHHDTCRAVWRLPRSVHRDHVSHMMRRRSHRSATRFPRATSARMRLAYSRRRSRSILPTRWCALAPASACRGRAVGRAGHVPPPAIAPRPLGALGAASWVVVAAAAGLGGAGAAEHGDHSPPVDET
jgi:hypothetical protein